MLNKRNIRYDGLIDNSPCPYVDRGDMVSRASEPALHTPKFVPSWSIGIFDMGTLGALFSTNTGW